MPDNQNLRSRPELSQRHQALLRQRPLQPAFPGLQQPAHTLQDLPDAGTFALARRGPPDRSCCPFRDLRNRSRRKPRPHLTSKPSPNCSTSRPASRGTENIPAAKSTFAPPPAPERSTRSSSIWSAAISPNLEAGVYHFAAAEFGLRKLRAGDYRSVLIEATANETAIAHAPLTIVCTATYWRNAWKYQDRTYRHFGWDNGTLLANLLAVGTALGLPAKVVCGFVDDTVNRLLDVDPQREVAFSLVPLGHASDAASASPQQQSLLSDSKPSRSPATKSTIPSCARCTPPLRCIRRRKLRPGAAALR